MSYSGLYNCKFIVLSCIYIYLYIPYIRHPYRRRNTVYRINICLITFTLLAPTTPILDYIATIAFFFRITLFGVFDYTVTIELLPVNTHHGGFSPIAQKLLLSLMVYIMFISNSIYQEIKFCCTLIHTINITYVDYLSLSYFHLSVPYL